MRAKIKTQYFFLASAFTASVFTATAQSTTPPARSSKETSPYSRFGIGMLSEQRQATLRGMGGIATGFTDPFGINSFNPASYSFLRATSLDFGLEARSRSILMNDESVQSGTAGFSYLNLGFPLGKHAGMSFGFTPISNVYYNQADTANIDGIGKVARAYEGSGGLQYAYIGFSGKFKGLSVGANFGYAFGNIINTSSLYQLDTTIIRNSEFNKRNSMGGVYWKGGVLYQVSFKKDQYLNIGATATLSQSLNINRDEYAIARSYDPNGIDLLSRDTVNQSYDAKGKLELPAEYSFGVHFGKSFYWDIGADFVYSDWKNFSNFGVKDSIANTAWRLGVGGEVTPDPLAVNKGKGKYFSTVTYRLGAYYGTDYISMRGKQLNYMGGTIGMSFPFRRSNSNYQMGRVHTALDIGKRGTIENGLAREFYVKFSVALSLNDLWFRKRRLE